MKPTLEELVERATQNEEFRKTLRSNPHLYSHLPDEAKDKLISALARGEVNGDDVEVDSRVSKYDATDFGDQGSWSNTPFTS